MWTIIFEFENWQETGVRWTEGQPVKFYEIQEQIMAMTNHKDENEWGPIARMVIRPAA